MVFTGIDKAELQILEAFMKEKGIKIEKEESRKFETLNDAEDDINVSDDSREV